MKIPEITSYSEWSYGLGLLKQWNTSIFLSLFFSFLLCALTSTYSWEWDEAWQRAGGLLSEVQDPALRRLSHLEENVNVMSHFLQNWENASYVIDLCLSIYLSMYICIYRHIHTRMPHSTLCFQPRKSLSASRQADPRPISCSSRQVWLSCPSPDFLGGPKGLLHVGLS